MYTVPWIINNMILEPTQMTKFRPPSEVELKVQKSLQQLTVPDWYANKCIASPKIIVDRRPFESRPAPWKDPIRIGAPLNNRWKNAIANSAVVKPVLDNEKIAHSGLETLSEVTKSKSAPSYSSKTFPKVSPSRKIQNINIVFPKTIQSQGTLVESTNDKVFPAANFVDKSIASIDSFEKFTPAKTSSVENKLTSLSVSTPIKSSGARALAFKETAKIPRMNCPPPAVPKTPPSASTWERCNFLDQSFSTPKKLAETEKILISPVTEFADTGFSTPQKNGRISRMNCPAPPAPSTPAKTSDKNVSNYLEQSSMAESVFLTPKKSTEMENIIKNEQKRSSGKSFVEEIIQELKAKCSPKVKSKYVSPSSKNFVKKLVRALEMGYAPKHDDDDNIFASCSDIECNSESSSASISIKDSDSGSGSDSEIKSSASTISSNSTFRRFSMALENREKTSRKSIVPYMDDEDESVYWIPLPNCKLPRTSSLKNIASKFSSYGGSSSSISSSPDSDGLREPPLSWQPTNSQNSNSSGWGTTFDKKQLRSRQLFRIDETAVIDSGYSDRSGATSSRSSANDESWYDDSETTQTASEIGDDYDNTYSSHARPGRLPSNRQRTFVI